MSGIITGNLLAAGMCSVTFNPASIAAATSAEQTVTVPGVRTGDAVVVIKPSATAGVGIVNARVSASDTVAITFMNATAGAVDPGSESYLFVWFRPESNPASVVGP